MKYIIVTGGNRGIGLSVVKALASHSNHIIVGCRDIETGLKSVKDFGGNIDVLYLDLTSKSSIDAFVDNVNTTYPKIDVLFNNAGIYSPQGHKINFGDISMDQTWATNVWGPYMLTQKLMPQLLKSAQPKLLFMSSVVANVNQFKPVTMFEDSLKEAYAQTKYANILMGAYFEAAYSNINSIIVHPGYTNTEIFEGRQPGLKRKVVRCTTNIFAQTPDKGARSALYAIQDNVATGSYVVPKGFCEIWGAPKIKSSSQYYRKDDLEIFKKLLKTVV